MALVTLTGGQLQAGNTSPINIPIPAYQDYSPCLVAWHAEYKDNGVAAYTVNTSLELISNAIVLGEATSAISGTADKVTLGTIVSAVVAAHSTAPLKVRVKTGDPSNGGADARCTVRVWYVHNDNYDSGDV